jgi:hypothetical protein
MFLCQFHTDAFQVSSPKWPTTPTSQSTDLCFFQYDSSTQPTGTHLLAKKNPVEPEREKSDALGLLLLYMTPWRNPNSIFVYMLLLLYALGKFSEVQSAAQMAGM